MAIVFFSAKQADYFKQDTFTNTYRPHFSTNSFEFLVHIEMSVRLNSIFPSSQDKNAQKGGVPDSNEIEAFL